MAGDTPEADELAKWLRARVAGRTTRQLESLFPFGRTQWSEFLKGRKLIPLWLLDSVIERLVPAQNRQLHRAHGHELLRAAEEAAAARQHSTAPAPSAEATPRDYELRLDAARQGQIKAQETVQSLTHLIYVFISAIADLNQRCESLEAERDQARQRLEQHRVDTTANQRRAGEDRQRVAETEQRLAETERRHAEFEERLARARREQQDAEDLRIEALQQAERNRRAFKQLTGRDTSAGVPGEDSGSVSTPQPWEYDHFLESADAQLDTHAASLETVRERIENPAPPPGSGSGSGGSRVIPGEVVPPPSTDGPDTPDTAVTGENAARSPSTDAPDSAPVPNVTTQGGDAAGPGDSARRTTKRLRIALSVSLCFAVLAGGWLAWDHAEGDDAGPPSVKADEPKSGNENDPLARLEKAKSGGRKWMIGTKADQPNLSEQVKGEWRGAEIDYARKIAKELGLKRNQYDFRAVSTSEREKSLAKGSIQMHIGTYGISESRMKGGPDRPPVIFAGPYFQTPQKIMLEKFKGSKDPYDVRIKGNRENVRSEEQLPDVTRVCQVYGSSAKAYLDEHPEEFPQIKRSRIQTLTDYVQCTGDLNTRFDAVLTDSVILQQIKNRNPGDYVISKYGFGDDEQYGIGLRKGAEKLRGMICKALEKTSQDRNTIYGKVAGEDDEYEDLPLSQCP